MFFSLNCVLLWAVFSSLRCVFFSEVCFLLWAVLSSLSCVFFSELCFRLWAVCSSLSCVFFSELGGYLRRDLHAYTLIKQPDNQEFLDFHEINSTINFCVCSKSVNTMTDAVSFSSSVGIATRGHLGDSIRSEGATADNELLGNENFTPCKMCVSKCVSVCLPVNYRFIRIFDTFLLIQVVGTIHYQWALLALSFDFDTCVTPLYLSLILSNNI